MKKKINTLVIGIVVLSLISSIGGLFWKTTNEEEHIVIQNVHGEEVILQGGNGLYKYDSISAVAQGKASDWVTMILALPCLLFSLYGFNQNRFRSRLFLCGTLGYFLYTYMSYTFLWTYNSFFLVYVLLMSLSFFALIAGLCTFPINEVPKHYKERFPTKLLGLYQILGAVLIGLLWMGQIIPTFYGRTPSILEHYTTLVIQGMDLGFIAPMAILSGILLIQRNKIGFLLSPIMIFKSITMLLCICAMMINMILVGVTVNLVEICLFSTLTVFSLVMFVVLFFNISNEKIENSAEIKLL